MRITDKKEAVKAVLKDHPVTRDDYYKLIGCIWWKEIGSELRTDPAIKKFFAKLGKGELSHPESIMRARRLIQADNEVLRGASYHLRIEQEQERVKREIIEDKLELE